MKKKFQVNSEHNIKNLHNKIINKLKYELKKRKIIIKYPNKTPNNNIFILYNLKINLLKIIIIKTNLKKNERNFTL